MLPLPLAGSRPPLSVSHTLQTGLLGQRGGVNTCPPPAQMAELLGASEQKGGALCSSVSPEPRPDPALHTPDKGRPQSKHARDKRHVKAFTAAKSGATLESVRANGCSHCGHFLPVEIRTSYHMRGECKTLYNSMQEAQRV